MVDNDEKIIKILESMDKRLDQQGKDIADVKQGQARTDTALEAVKAGIDDIQEHMATRQDVERVEKEVDNLKKRLPPHRAD